jgi:hypothetical protein
MSLYVPVRFPEASHHIRIEIVSSKKNVLFTAAIGGKISWGIVFR